MPVPKGTRVGGRQKGTPNKVTATKAAEVAASGLTPLDYLLSVMRNEENEQAARIDAAKAAAPYSHPRLSTVDAKVEVDGSLDITVVELVALGPGED